MPRTSPATTYVMVADETLADQATAVAEVRVVASDPRAGIGEPVTEYRMSVEDVIIGNLPASPLAVRVRGGRLPDGAGLEIYGAPRFEPGERALLFLEPQDDGTYRILHFMLGAFHLAEVGGERYAVRRLSEAVEVDPPGRARARRGPRHLGRFRAWLEDRRRGVERPADYFVDSRQAGLYDRLQKFSFLESGGVPIRWTIFDTGGSVTWRAHEDGQPGVTGGGFSEFQTALQAWVDEPQTPLLLPYGGTTTATGGLTFFDGVNAILFDDPNGEIGQPYNCLSGGVLAIGGPWFGGQHTHNGTTFRTAQGGDVVTNQNVGCFLSQGLTAEEVFAHEVGHALGLGHSCGDAGLPPCSGALDAALMRPFAHGGAFGATLGSDDQAGIRALYGDPGQIFTDGFESGDTLSWSSTKP